MGSIFGGGSRDTPDPPPPPPPPAPVPTLDEAKMRQQSADDVRRRRGRRASVLTGDEGVSDTPTTTRTLIGS